MNVYQYQAASKILNIFNSFYDETSSGGSEPTGAKGTSDNDTPVIHQVSEFWQDSDNPFSESCQNSLT